MEQKIVVHLTDGAIHKGVTQDFSPTRPAFHVLAGEGGGVPLKVRLNDMKAMFWVKDYLGNRDFVARRDFDPSRKPEGKRAILTFHDGETIWGMVTEDDAATPGFYFVPADEADNNIKLFVIRTALKELRWAP
jgi:Family of unknown function (DUF6982)